MTTLRTAKKRTHETTCPYCGAKRPSYLLSSHLLICKR